MGLNINLMKKNFILLMCFTLFVVAVNAQKDDKSKTKGNKKDRQNQTKFLKPDMEATEFSYDDRKAISVPEQVSYDLDSAVYQKGKKKTKQQQAYLQNKYYYPARPKDQWELGVNLGMAMVSGDVKPYWQHPWENFGVGLQVRKALGYIFSLRGGYNYYRMTGRNWEGDANLDYNSALHGASSLYPNNPNYYNNPTLANAPLYDANGTFIRNVNMNGNIFHNYKTQVHEVHVEAIANLGNLLFHRERNIVNLYLFGGFSGYMYNTKINQLDANGKEYNYAQAWDIWTNRGASPNVNSDLSVKKNLQNKLNSIWDKTYESQAEHETNIPGIKNYSLYPGFSLGTGLQFHVTKVFTLGIEQKFILSLSDDLIDGYRWQQSTGGGKSFAVTRDYDNISYTNIQFMFHLGKNRVEPLYWLNPMHQTYKKLGDVNPDKIANDILQDDDEDGVPNKLDKEANTKKGAPVDVKGVALDSDKDGLIDIDDKEPYSPAGCPIDKFGVAQCPPPACCADAAKTSGTPAYDCSKMELPSVNFEDDKYYVSPEYYGNLHQVAQKLQMCPDTKLVVTGYDESKSDRKYNEQLAYNRANSAIDYLTSKYGISRDRFVVKYEGKAKTGNKTGIEAKKSRRVEFGYATDGDTGSSNPPAPHPGLKAGSDK